MKLVEQTLMYPKGQVINFSLDGFDPLAAKTMPMRKLLNQSCEHRKGKRHIYSKYYTFTILSPRFHLR